jgi:hypothetical protein
VCATVITQHYPPEQGGSTPKEKKGRKCPKTHPSDSRGLSSLPPVHLAAQRKHCSLCPHLTWKAWSMIIINSTVRLLEGGEIPARRIWVAMIYNSLEISGYLTITFSYFHP